MVAPRCRLSSKFAIFLIFCSVSPLLLPGGVFGQPRTDPSEVRALNSIFSGWGISSSLSTISWNTTGDPCSGAAVDSSASLDDEGFNPGIKCNCSFTDATICHITELKVVDNSDSVQGGIPDDLKFLRKLATLQLHDNSLSGPLPEFIGNMTALEKLNLSSNTLSGGIQKEIGNLRNLFSLDLSINKFNGSLPMELGNLTNLKELKLNSIGVGGAIPSTLRKLQKLRVLWISDNSFNGSVPAFIGQFVELEDLRLQGNSFQGPIPASFSNLIKLTRLQIGEFLNSSSNLEFIENMTSLNILILRNSKISGTLPSFFGRFIHLDHLDLSFNSLSGQLPTSLLFAPSLKYLFLGNNSLTGILPSQKSPILQNIDISYNEFSGSFPAWVNNPDLKINLVANNFFMDNLSDSNLPLGWRCLQRNIPCHLNSPIQTSFAINCGGKLPVNANNGPTYVTDSFDLSTASFNVSNGIKWGVSTVGRFLDVQIPIYIQSTLSRFSNTQDPDLYQSARLSPSSIRYYGLGLYNGNYTVRLMFGESDNWKPNKGRRLFDIYMQGMLVAKDFDITEKAGGRTLVAADFNCTIAVTNNFLEIHLFWAGKGTCCVPTNAYYGPSISAIRVTPEFTLPDDEESTSAGRNKGIIAGVAVAVFTLCFILVFIIIIWRHKKKMREDEDEELRGLSEKPNSFSHQELRTATGDFNLANKLGEGAFGFVYKGVLSDGKTVAVKQLLGSSVHGKRQFVTEVATISAVQHRNLVKLLGCCYEGKRRLLVLEYHENGSLDQSLFGERKLLLDWPARFRICLGVGKGLAYLHEECDPQIIHRDVKASNILLDSDLNPKISDFGLAKLREDKKSHLSTGVAGTVGYLAPEYAMRGQLTEKADVFGFGVLLFEILCGRRNMELGLDAEKVYLLEWVWHLHHEKRELDMLDPILTSYNKDEVLRVIGVAFLCTQAPPTRRPPMSRVVSMFVGDAEVTEVLAWPSYLLWRYAEASTSYSTATNPRSTLFDMPSGLATPTSMTHLIEEGR